MQPLYFCKLIFPWFCLIFFISYAGITLFTLLSIRNVVHSHIPADYQQPKDVALVPQAISLGPANRRIAGWHFPLPHPKGGVVLVHGLGLPRGGKAQMLVHAKFFHDLGWETVAIDLYSFGESDGQRITFGSDEWQDVQEAWQFLKHQPYLRDKPVGLCGISMGGVSAIIAAGKEKAGDFVIASVPYPTVPDLLLQQSVLRGYPKAIMAGPVSLASRILIPQQRNAKDYISLITVPLLIIQGQFDERVPLSITHSLTRNVPLGSTIVIMEAGHDIHAEKPIEFHQVIGTFLQSHFPS